MTTKTAHNRACNFASFVILWPQEHAFNNLKPAWEDFKKYDEETFRKWVFYVITYSVSLRLVPQHIILVEFPPKKTLLLNGSFSHYIFAAMLEDDNKRFLISFYC